MLSLAICYPTDIEHYVTSISFCNTHCIEWYMLASFPGSSLGAWEWGASTTIGTCRAVWVPGQDLATPDLMRDCRKRHYTVPYMYVCARICYTLVTTCLRVRSSWYEYAWFEITWAMPGLGSADTYVHNTSGSTITLWWSIVTHSWGSSHPGAHHHCCLCWDQCNGFA